MATHDDKITLENVNIPGYTERVDRSKYEAKTAPIPLLPQDLFPQGAKARWWLKAPQLDLEAMGIIVRENCKPLRLRLA